MLSEQNNSSKGNNMQRDSSDLLTAVTLALFIGAVAIWANILVKL